MHRLTALFLFLFPFLCIAQGAHRIGQVLVKGNNVAANVAPNANIQVCVLNTACKQFAPIFSDPSLTVQLQQPVIADGNGNYSYYITTGCVDEQISTPGQGQIFVPNVCPFNGQAGGGGGGNVVGQLNRVGSFSNSTTTKPTNGTVDSAGNQFTLPAVTVSNTTVAPFTLNQTCANPLQAVPSTNTRYACNLWNLTNSATPNVGQHTTGFRLIESTVNLTGPGMNPGTNGSINTFEEAQGGGPLFTTNSYQRGNHSGFAVQSLCFGGGDCQGANINATAYANASVGADEGTEGIRQDVNQAQNIAGTIVTGGTPGSTQLNTNINGGFFFDQGYVYDNSLPAGTAVVTSIPTRNAGLNAITQTVSGLTMTPSTAWGTMVPSSVDYHGVTPIGLYQTPNTVTANITLGTSPASPGPFTVGSMTCAGNAVEFMQVTAVGPVNSGVQSVTFVSRNAWDNSAGNTNNAACIQGGSVSGQGFVRTGIARPALYPILGAINSNTMVFANCGTGDCNGVNTSNLLPISTGISLFPYAEVIGTLNAATPAVAQLGFNNVAWANGHTVVAPIAAQGVLTGIHSNVRVLSPQIANTLGVNGIIQQGSTVFSGFDIGEAAVKGIFNGFTGRADGNPATQYPLYLLGGQGTYQNGMILQRTPPSGGCIVCAIGSNSGEGATFTGSITSGVLTVTSVASGFILSSQELQGASVPAVCQVVAIVPGTGVQGGPGQYPLICPGVPNIASQTFTTVKGQFFLFNVGVQGGANTFQESYNANTREYLVNVANSNGPFRVISTSNTLTSLGGIGTRCVNASSAGLLGTQTCATVTSVGLTVPTWATGSGTITSSGTFNLGLPAFIGSGSSHAPGIVPDPGASAGTTKFLREDGTWVIPTSGFTGSCAPTATISFVNGLVTGCS